MDTTTTARAAVRRGATVLDDLMPDWAARIDVLDLDLAYTDQCVLGQLFAADDPTGRGMGYEPGVTAVSGLPDDTHFEKRRAWAAEYGFDVPAADEGEDVDFDERTREYAVLRDLWAAEILRRTR